MDPRYKTLIIAGSIGSVLIGLVVVGALAYRARFTPPQETGAPPVVQTPPAGGAPSSGTTTSLGGSGSAGGATGGSASGSTGGASSSAQTGVRGVADPTPDFTQGPDRDNDGLSDASEAVYGTDPDKSDTDGDGYSDGDEVLKYGSDPKDKASTPATIEGHEKFNL
jgi:hypothetical protein